MATNNSQSLEEMIKTLPKGKERDLWQKVLEEARRFEGMTDAAVKADLEAAGKEADIAQDQLKLLEMDEKEREKEVARRKAEAERKKEMAEKEWEEAVAAVTPVLVEEDVLRRSGEAVAMKKITSNKIEDLSENLKSFLDKNDLAGSGAVLKQSAVLGKIGEVLNYFGYPSNLEGMHQFFNNELLRGRAIQGEKAYENLLFQQKVYALEQDISCLAQGLNNWSLAFAMVRKQRIWHQMEKNDHLLVVAEKIRKFKPQLAARIFGPPSYGFFDKNKNFILGSEGKLILMLFSEDFAKQIEEGNFNPETARFFADNQKQLEALNLGPSFFSALKKYSENLKTGLMATEKFLAESEK